MFILNFSKIFFFSFLFSIDECGVLKKREKKILLKILATVIIMKSSMNESWQEWQASKEEIIREMKWR
jgi:hypothetical protein